MKKIIALSLAILMLFSLCACGGGTSKELTIGDETETEQFRFTLKSAEFTDKILVCYGEKADKNTFGNAEEFFTPSEKPFVDEDGYVIDGIHGFSMKKDSDNTYLYYNIEFEFIGKEEYNRADLDFKPIVSYGKYKFDTDYMAFGKIIDKIKFNSRMWFTFNYDNYYLIKALGLDLGGFDSDLKPLSGDKYEIRGIIEVPKAVAEDTQGSVILSFAGKDYIVK